jgi:ribA/ribD-fused uncharacterized protein
MIDSFSGPNRFLSNFWPCRVFLDERVYTSTENAYQAAKTLIFDDRKPFESCAPGQAKRLGRRLIIRTDWEEVKLKVMEELLRQKFSYPALKEMLLATGDQKIEEGNYWGDTFWGVCRGVGHNHLGKLLMTLRGELQFFGKL